MDKKRIFGSPLRDMDNRSKFSLDLPIDVMALDLDESYAPSLLSPHDFIENERIACGLSEDEAYLFKPTVEYSRGRGWFYTVAYVALHEVAAGANAAVVLTTAGLAATLVVAAFGVLASAPDSENGENFFKKIDNEFLRKISKEALKIGGISYMKNVIEEFVQIVKEYNRMGEEI